MALKMMWWCRLQKGGEVAVRVDGPYGEAEGQPDYVHYPLLVMFAGGIGVREAPSVLKLQSVPIN